MRNRQVVAAASSLPRSSSCRSTQGIIPAYYSRSSSTSVPDPSGEFADRSLIVKGTAGSSSPISFQRFNKTRYGFSSLLKSFFNIISFPAILPTCRWLNITTQLSITPSLGRKVTGTLFGNRRGHVSFAVQENPRSEPVSVIELAVTTASLARRCRPGWSGLRWNVKKACLRVPGRPPGWLTNQCGLCIVMAKSVGTRSHAPLRSQIGTCLA